MTAKEKVLEKIQELPEDLTAAQIREQLDLILAVQEGIDSAETEPTRSKGEVRNWL